MISVTDSLYLYIFCLHCVCSVGYSHTECFIVSVAVLHSRHSWSVPYLLVAPSLYVPVRSCAFTMALFISCGDVPRHLYRLWGLPIAVFSTFYKYFRDDFDFASILIFSAQYWFTCLLTCFYHTSFCTDDLLGCMLTVVGIDVIGILGGLGSYGSCCLL